MRHCWIVISIFLCHLLSGCSKKDAAGPQEVTDVSINKWVLDRMRVYYYWNASLPSAPNYSLEPNVFFDGLKNASDRFSRMYYEKNPQGLNGTLINNFGFDVT